MLLLQVLSKEAHTPYTLKKKKDKKAGCLNHGWSGYPGCSQAEETVVVGGLL